MLSELSTYAQENKKKDKFLTSHDNEFIFRHFH